MKIIEKNSVGFSRPCDFNDPFELAASYPSEEGKNPIDFMFNEIRTWAKKDIWNRNTAILSLTRQPLNALMWAHYGEEHKGLVIGFDAKINEFTCDKTNLVPVQYGNVIYTNKKPDTPFLSKPTEAIKVGETFHFRCDQLERLQRTFLFKPACWSYEEEVRIAKCIKGIEKSKTLKSGTFSEIKVDERPLYLLHIPKGAIKEIYVGVRRSQAMDLKNAKGFISTARKHQPDIKLFGCNISKCSWELESFDLEKAANNTC
ncbi:MAG: DUF2971 domain-containing protein [Proteobacteria bacterium]|nr:DUF2971 domain-containing protein [Pseudomonadota bacterium]